MKPSGGSTGCVGSTARPSGCRVSSCRCGAGAEPVRSRCGAGAEPVPISVLGALVRTDGLSESRRIQSERGRPGLMLHHLDADAEWTEQAVSVATQFQIPLLLCTGQHFEPSSKLYRWLRHHPRAILMPAASADGLARLFRRVLSTGLPPCASTRILAALPTRGDRVTQSIVTSAIISSATGMGASAVALLHRMSTSAVRARFAASGLASPSDVLANARALHALWSLLEEQRPTDRVARQLRFGTTRNLLERIRVGTGRSLRTWRVLGFAEALECMIARMLR